MISMKTLQQREKELRTLISTAGGRVELEELELRYAATGYGRRATRTSVVTFILVYEREHGLIAP
jgi:hypothetical protein